MAEIDDRIDVGTALTLLGAKSAPMATCSADGEPLVCTMEFPGAEFICVQCGALYGWLSPTPATWTQALQDRHDELKAQYDIARAERKAARG